MATCPACGADDTTDPGALEVQGRWAPVTAGNYSVTEDGRSTLGRVLELHCNRCDWTSQPGTIDPAGFVPQEAPTTDVP